jgi:hypothetical protein
MIVVASDSDFRGGAPFGHTPAVEGESNNSAAGFPDFFCLAAEAG